MLCVFEVLELKDTPLNILLSMAVCSASGLFLLNSLIMFEQKNKLSILSLSLIFLSSILFFILIWNDHNKSSYVKFTWSIGFISITINLIVGYILKLQRTNLITQIITYSIYFVTLVIIIYSIYNKAIATLLWPPILCSLIFTVILTINSKKNITDKYKEEYIKIPKSEYELLLNKIKMLEEKNGIDK